MTEQLAETAAPSPSPTELRAIVEGLRDQNGYLTESLQQVTAMFAHEDRGWSKWGEIADDGMTLDEMKDWSTQIRNSMVGNPHIKRAFSLRHGYGWQGGIQYRGVPTAKQGRSNPAQSYIDLPANQRNAFGAPARRRREGCLFSDGIYILLGNESDKTLRNLPLREITADYRDPDHEEDVWAYRRSWTHHNEDGTTDERAEWYFTDTFADKRVNAAGRRVTHITSGGKSDPVNQTTIAFDQIANSVEDYAYGSPDAIAALIWSRIVRTLYMDGVSITGALATFAFTASSGNKAGTDNAAMKLASAASAGATAVLGATDSLVPLSSAGKGYDFSSFDPTVALIATSLDLTLEDLSGTAEAGNNTASSLPLPTRLAIETRRAEHVAFDKRILTWLGAPDAEVFFKPLLDPADLYRAQQGIAIKLGTGLYEGEEIKTAFESLDGNDITDVKVPDGFMLPNNLKTLEAEGKIAAKNAPKPADASNGGNMAPTQGSGAKFTGGGSGDQSANDINGDRASGK